jgi:hypothetical protein
MRFLACFLVLPFLARAEAQVRPVYSAIESYVGNATQICVGKVESIESVVVNQHAAIELTIKVTETLKGTAKETLIAHRFDKDAEQHYAAAQRAGVPFVWFVFKDTARIDFCLDPAYSEYKSLGGLAVGMDFTILRSQKEVLDRIRQFMKENPDAKGGESLLTALPGQPLTAFVDFNIPLCPWTETLAIRMITKPDSFLFGPQKGNPDDAATPEVWKQSKEGMLRVQGLMLLRHFRSPANIRLAQRYLNDPLIAMAGEYGEPIKLHFWVRDAAYRLLRSWDVEVPSPVVFGPVIEYRIGLFPSREFGLDRNFAPRGLEDLTP